MKRKKTLVTFLLFTHHQEEEGQCDRRRRKRRRRFEGEKKLITCTVLGEEFRSMNLLDQFVKEKSFLFCLSKILQMLDNKTINSLCLKETDQI